MPDEPRIVHYGPDSDQYGEVWAPAPGPVPAPVVVLIHGGYWRVRYRLDLMHPLAADLAGRGYGVWNIEYRRTGQPGGGWPGTFADVANAVDALAHLAPRYGWDPGRVAVVGHSAGGHLALWLAGRHRLPAGVLDRVGAAPRVTPVLAVSLAGVCDLTEAARLRLSNGAVLELLGGEPSTRPDLYQVACPYRLLPLGVPQLVVHGTADTHVPPELSHRYAAAAGTECELLTLPGVDHFAVIDPASAAWAAVAGELVHRITPGRRART